MRFEINCDIIDFHCHPFISSDCSIAGYGFPDGPSSFVSELAKCGISRFCGSVIKRLSGDSFDDFRALNDQALELQKLFPDSYIPGFHVAPQFPEESCAEIERMHAAGLTLIGELVWYMHGYKAFADKAFDPIWDLAQSYGMTVSIHPTNIQDMDDFMTRFPKLSIVMAHPGEKTDYLAKLELLKKHPNAYLDICGTGLFRYGMLPYGIQTVGRDRFLFGTDFPTCSIGMQVGSIISEVLSEDDINAVCSLNAKRLLGLR